ncbi:choline dehydrogenase [Falsiroseomonas bella]|uniref:Choline dehydrogenase n=1 Tax=Falsiroseomonas bella TaxID=2184016 RepID=A0A317FGM0_9PROT|nr:GMC family oxidoreductase N-terminal domain-containing protein [Falsiroseomonas bella]PWS38211.1 choline dehydrogenase [Falsiroseomonas bella]
MQPVEADIIVVGGGSAGCIVAARMSEDPGTRVLLLEAGPPDSSPWVALPAGYARLFGSQVYDPKFNTEPVPALNDRAIHWPRGRVLGGSGSVNGLVFLRGSPHDYDRWAQAGARGWSYEDCAPAFRRMETWLGPPSPERGDSGPIRVMAPRRMARATQAFVDAAAAAGIRRHRDVNDGSSIEGVGPVQLNVDGRFRSSSARTYLRPAMKRPNLEVRTGIQAHRLLFEGNRCVGVATAQGTFRARRCVVASCGALETPKLLMLSGIGDGAALQAMGLPVVVHSPDVGRNLQDHLIAKFIWRVKPCGTLNEILASKVKQAAMGLDWLLRKAGPMAVGAGEASAFVRVTPGAEEAEAQLLFINFATFDYRQGLTPFPGLMLNYGACRPDSRGTLTLRSPDPADPPVIRPNYLDHPNDLRVMLGAAAICRDIARQAPLRDLIEEELRPGPEATTDAAIEANIRATASTVFHPCGTARMGSDDRAVLDPELRVRGVEGLRVADASVFPLIPSPNIQPAALMVGERCAEFLRRAA